MKKIRYLVLGLVFAFVGVSSFSSACSLMSNLYYYDDEGFTRAGDSFSPGNYCLPEFNGFFCFDTAGTITTPKGGSFSYSPLDYANCVYLDNANGGFEYTSNSYFNFDIYLPGGSSCENTPSLSCSNTGSISEILDDLILYSGSVSLNNSSYTNIFNYGDNGAGTYCVKLTSSSPQTLTFGFANGGTTTPTNLYQLYNDQYNNYVCLYGNKAYFNAKLNSSSNTVNYQVYKLTDLYSHDICIEDSQDCPSCPECEDCSSCQSSLGACLEDNLSLENMNESLSSQLETCLLNGGNGCDPEVDTGCITGAFQVPLLSWSVGLDSFTTPIINNLVLPTNYKGKVVDGVLTISSINNNLSISDQDMASIKDSIVEVLEFIFGLSLFLVLIYYIKFYMFNSK